MGTRLALTCSLVLLSACSERVSFLAPKFQMGPNNAQALVVTPDGEVHESGKLTVSIRGFLDTLTKKRRLLATLADVEYVVVEVSASGLSFSQTIAKADLDNGTTSATFAGIPEGTATVTMKAYNLTNQLIGQASKTTSVTAGATTTVELQLQLDPTYTQPSTGGGTSTGSITANGTIIDGPVIEGTPPPPAGTVIGTYQLDNSPSDIAIAADGSVWIANDTNSEAQQLTKLSSEGLLIGHFNGYEPLGGLLTAPCVDASTEGHVWLGAYGLLLKFASDGQLLASFEAQSEIFKVLGSDDGGAWLNAFTGMSLFSKKINADGTEGAFATYATTGPNTGQQMDIALDSLGSLWATGYTPAEGSLTNSDIDTLTKFSAAGQQLSVYSLPTGSEPFRIVMDSSDHMWVTLMGSQSVAKISPDGTLLGTFAVSAPPRDIAIDPAGNVWVTSESTTVLKLSSAGTQLGSYEVPSLPDALAVGTSGAWITNSSGKTVTRLAL